jgi:hypothetical protein
MNIFIIYIYIIRFRRFWNKNIVYFDVPNHAFFKSFKNVTLVIFLELFGQEQKFGIGFTIFLMIFFLR